MKRTIVIICSLVFIISATLNTQAQKLLMKKANKLYELKAYAKAIPYYESALAIDSTIPQALIHIADCYRLINNSYKAERYYSQVVNMAFSSPIHIYYYAQALMQTGNYEAAKKYMSEYHSDDRGKKFEEAIAKIQQFYKDSAYYKVNAVPFNSKQNDFSPVLYNDTNIIFISARTRTQLIGYTHAWTNQKYYALYITSKDEFGFYRNPKIYARNIQVRFNDGPICFDKSENTIYVTRNNFRKNKLGFNVAVKSSNGDVKLNLYTAELDQKKKRFMNLKGFAFNSNEYNTAHPTLSPDGKRLYFSSDMPGTLGGMDLWMAEKAGDAWSSPVNLGETVNTKGDDVFPYVLDSNTLYFSSNGFEGIGGLDIFSVRLKIDGMPAGDPKNIGAPMNSNADDFGIIFNPDGKTGFFSSNRVNFDLDDDIYSFRIIKPEKQPYHILVRDSTTLSLLGSNLSIKDVETGERIDLSENNGQFTVDLLPEHNYSLGADAIGYVARTDLKYITPAESDKAYEILLAKVFVPKYFISGTIYERFEDSTSKPLDSARIVITETVSGNNVCTTYVTDASGKYHSCDLKPNTAYTINVMRDGFFSKSGEVPSIPPGGAIKDFYLSRIVIGKAIKIENIYFDLNKWNIRPDAAKELDKIVTLMQENPQIIIELGSHTDCRSSYQYNMDLSDKRAKSSAAYIVSKGIDANRITGRGYGESQLVNDCKCEGAVKSNCTEEQHQQNRRTEFKVTGFIKGMGNVNVKSTKQ